MDDAHDSRSPQVAVIAIHGVADQAANETARSVAKLLSKRNVNGAQRHYAAFDEHPLSVPLRPLVLDPLALRQSPPESGVVRRLWSKFRDIFDERPPYLRDRHDSNSTDADPEYEFMYNQLNQYRGEGAGATYYETVRLRGARIDHERKQHVDIFEMYWADLSRLGTAITQVFSELYQLLFHLGSLGRKTVDLAQLEAGNEKRRSWTVFAGLQRAAIRTLTLPIPILNLFLLAAVLVAVLATLPTWLIPLIVVGCLGGLIAVGYNIWVFRQVAQQPRAMSALSLVLWLGFVVSLMVTYVLVSSASSGFYLALWIVGWCIAGVCIWRLLQGYERRRPGAVFVGSVVALVLAIHMVVMLPQQWDRASIIVITLHMTEDITIGLIVAWTLFSLFQVLAWGAGKVAINRTAAGAPRDRAARAEFTTRLTLAVPGALLVIATLTFWLAVGSLSSTELADITYTPAFSSIRWSTNVSGAVTAGTFVMSVLQITVGRTLILLGPGITIAIILAICAVAPVALADVRPPRAADPGSAESKRLGAWLSNGFGWMRWSGQLFFFSTAILLPAGGALGWLLQYRRQDVAQYFDVAAAFILSTLSGLVIASAASLVVSNLRLGGIQKHWRELNNFLLGVRPALDILFDLDNYLREYPLDRTPRARICGRYVSLLKHICCWQDPEDGKGYSALVIVSHSQGTVITADLLRFLRQVHDDDLERLGGDLPIYLLTVGSPLRQLYGLRFPHLYRWARHMDSSAWDVDRPPFISDDQAPNPQELGVQMWLNAFRSGDYVGRYLWRSDICSYQWEHDLRSDDPQVAWVEDLHNLVRITRDEQGLRQEWCVGAGAHLHYLDETAPQVAAAIDYLIGQAAHPNSRYGG